MAAKIRAYKLAEELGIEKNEFVEKAREIGIELKGPTAALEEEQVALVREKLGEATKPSSRKMEERRVDRKGGAAVIRRRRKVAPEPEPEPEPLVEAEPVVAEVEAEPEAEPTAEEPEAEPVAAVAEEQPAVVPSGDEAPVRPAGDAGAGTRRDAGRGAQVPSGAPGGGKGKQRKRVREVVNLREQEQFGRQITSRGGGARRAPVAPGGAMQNPRRKRRDALAKPVSPVAAADQKRVVRVPGEIGIGELAKQAGVKAPLIQGKLMAMGIMVSVNQRIDVATCQKIADEFKFEVVDTGFKEEEFITVIDEVDKKETGEGEPRPPVVTVMGHVDHGKTSILDAIRKSAVVDGEAGGITQHIGAYRVDTSRGPLTFIDTPGHAAFTAMRARGAQATDIVILVVAANDGVMPQTIEAIEHCRAADVPMVVAINKCDLPEADPKTARQRLMEHDLVPEDFGGDIICVDVSAKTGDGLEQLLEMVALQSEILELTADPKLPAKGVVLEAHLDKGRGPLATVLIQSGTLNRGETVVVGTEWGRVRLMEDHDGKKVNEAGPSTPVRLIGLSAVPELGSVLDVVKNERAAKSVIQHRVDQKRSAPSAPRPRMSLEEFYAQADVEEAKDLKLVIKADVAGTREAVVSAVEDLATEAVKVTILTSGVGAINENDVMLASASSGIVVGFNVRPDNAATRAADTHGIEIRNYTIIMNLIDDIRSSMAGLLPPTIKEVPLGRAEVRETFVIPKLGTIAGSYVNDGKVKRGARCRLVRDGIQVYEGTIASLRRFKDDVAEVGNDFECGIGIGGYNDVKVGDVIEAFELEEEPATL
ncbi:MAG: translation initiation factor IF-2 [Myxococcota bacterium]|jgi:translation initiation factor IF-2|nr:translation initiation factor IF-2 [Myxococcota bacterium]